MWVRVESVLELGFIHKQPFRSLCATLDGRLTSKACAALKGSPYSPRRKECFGLSSREVCQTLTTAKVPHTCKAAAGACFTTSFPQRCLPETGPVLWIHTVESLCTTAPLLSHDNFCKQQLVLHILSGLSPTFPFYLLFFLLSTTFSQTDVPLQRPEPFDFGSFVLNTYTLLWALWCCLIPISCERDLLQVMRASVVTVD